MNIYEKTEQALSGLDLPYWYGTPHFSGNPPETYLVYSAYDTPEHLADGEERAYSYTVTVNIVTPAVDVELRKRVRRAMKAAGFVYQQGLPMSGNDDIYPYPEQYSQEYKIVLEE